MNIHGDIVRFLQASLECSVHVRPLDPGLTYDELVHVARSADFLDGEIHDGIPKAATQYFGTSTDKILLEEHDLLSLAIFIGEEEPEYRNRAAFHRVFEVMRHLVRERGVANASIERSELVRECVNNQVSAHDVQVAITILVLNKILHESGNGIRFAHGKESYGSPGDPGNMHRRPSGQQVTRREARARAYPIVKQFIGASHEPVPALTASPEMPTERVTLSMSNDEWISARAALELLGRDVRDRTHAICLRAHAGLIKARAKRFMSDSQSVDAFEVPSRFWWAEGGAALKQNWDTGDFETWLDKKIRLRAFGVQFLRSDIEVMKGAGGVENKMKATKVFIGHGRSNEWKELRDLLRDRLKLTVVEYNILPTAGLTTVERLQEMLDEATFAFLVLTAEDEQPDGSIRARENVIHEAGLFQGRLGFRKAIIMLENDCNEFSNIAGLGEIRFQKGHIEGVFEKVRGVLEREKIIKAL